MTISNAKNKSKIMVRQLEGLEAVGVSQQEISIVPWKELIYR
jgi:hypothetical protein